MCISRCVTFYNRNYFLSASFNLPGCLSQVALVGDVVPSEHARRLVAADFYGYRFANAAPRMFQIALRLKS
jgi:hypothetical protein